MTEQHESRWSLNHTGNRVALALLIGVIVGALANASVDLSGFAHTLVIAVVTGLTYLLVTVLRR